MVSRGRRRASEEGSAGRRQVTDGDRLAQRHVAATLSAYEHGHKSPTLATASRILAAIGHRFAVEPQVAFTERRTAAGVVFSVPDRLFRLALPAALATVTVPSGATYDLADREQRRRAYQAVLVEGCADDILATVDGALLADLWPRLDLPTEIRAAWQPLIEAALNHS